jgi:hypothetical protein
MAIGTECLIGKKMMANLSLDAWYLNDGAVWATTAAALAGIPSGSRSPGQLVNVAGVLYWFNTAMTDLVTVFSASTPAASAVAITDTATLYTATEVEAALAEVMTAHNALGVTVSNFGTGTLQVPFKINLTAQSSVAARVAAATETTDYPTGWTIEASSVTNLLITHTLTGRHIAHVDIWETDGSKTRLVKPFGDAYSGIEEDGLTVLIEGLDTLVLALRIELLFD